MTAYVANHEKKNRLFAKRERELIHALKHSFSDDKTAAAAERLRDAKMGAFKCQFARFTAHQPHTLSPQEMAADNEQVRKWLLKSTADIIETYRKKIPAQSRTARVPGFTVDAGPA